MKYKIKQSTKFKKDYKKYNKNSEIVLELKKVLTIISN
jgi:mRNA-degrading endonuclease YafQ of YafQ-DinJ toxin-antitoxin module